MAKASPVEEVVVETPVEEVVVETPVEEVVVVETPVIPNKDHVSEVNYKFF